MLSTVVDVERNLRTLDVQVVEEYGGPQGTDAALGCFMRMIFILCRYIVRNNYCDSDCANADVMCIMYLSILVLRWCDR